MEMIGQKKRLGKDQALQKLKHYCGYQERCHTEVKEKLYSFGLYKQEVEECISLLIEEEYLNEERFAIAYAGGKFRMKGWGKIKIRHALKEKGVSEYCINNALKEINSEQYETCLHRIAANKWGELRSEKSVFIKMKKAQDHLLQKGFEMNLVQRVIASLRGEDNQDK
jgi:regulatory protein